MKINPLIVFRKEFDGSGLLFNPENGETFGLNPTAAFIWEELETGSSPALVLEHLAEKTDIPESAPADLNEFIAALKIQGYVAEE